MVSAHLSLTSFVEAVRYRIDKKPDDVGIVFTIVCRR
jgi:hypothetical protein